MGFGEFRQNWRPLLAAFLGIGSALSLNSYILSTFAPYLIDDLGWSRADWALLGIVQILVVICLPLAGRLADLFGVRRVAAVGALSFPAFLVAIALMPGNLGTYIAIYLAQTVVCATTTTVVYSRLVAAAFSARRGLALAICGSSTPLIAALGSPWISAYVDVHGWRAGYLVVAAFSMASAVITLLLIPHQEPAAAAPRGEPFTRVYRQIAAMPTFWILLVATFLVNAPFALAASQLKLVVLEQGLTDATAALLISAFALGSVGGRALSGLMIDYLPGQVVAAVSFALPVAGLLLLASPLDSTAVVTTGILMIGISFGAEGDIIPYLVTRYFDLGIYSTVLGLMSGAMGLAMALGSVLLGLLLNLTGDFTAYLLIAAATSLVGSAMFLFLGTDVKPAPSGGHPANA